MNGLSQDDIIRMAREADLLTTTEPNGYQVWIPENLEAFAALVAAAEREECARTCDKLGDEYADTNAADCAFAIRERGAP